MFVRMLYVCIRIHIAYVLCICIQIHTCLYKRTHTYSYICIHVHICIQRHTFMQTCIHICLLPVCLLCSEDREAATWSQTNMVMQGEGGTMGCAHPVWAWDQYNVALCAAVTLALQVCFLVYALPPSSSGRHHSIGTDSQHRSLGRAHFSSSQPRYSSTR